MQCRRTKLWYTGVEALAPPHAVTSSSCAQQHKRQWSERIDLSHGQCRTPMRQQARGLLAATETCRPRSHNSLLGHFDNAANIRSQGTHKSHTRTTGKQDKDVTRHSGAAAQRRQPTIRDRPRPQTLLDGQPITTQRRGCQAHWLPGQNVAALPTQGLLAVALPTQGC